MSNADKIVTGLTQAVAHAKAPEELFVVFNDDYDPEAVVNAVHLVADKAGGVHYTRFPENTPAAAAIAVGGYVYGRIDALMNGAEEKFDSELDYLADMVSRIEEAVFPWMADQK